MASPILTLAVAVAFAGATPPAPADPDPRAELAAIVAAHRNAPDLRIVETVSVRTGPADGGEAGEGTPVRIEIESGGGRRAVVRLRGFELRLADGSVSATHESNPDAYLATDDGGSPYYALFAAFVDLPFPTLALVLGEDDPDEVAMQLHPRTPWVKPVRIEAVAGDPPRRRLVLEAEGESLALEYDPATMLLDGAVARVTGGRSVPAGAALVTRHEIRSERRPEPFPPERFRFDPGTRAKVDALAALVRGPAPAAAVAASPVGRPVPPLRLPSSAGGEVDLEDFLGRVVVLDFWASWCGPCRDALPKVARFAEDARRRGWPVAVVPVNVLEKESGAALRDLVRRAYGELGIDPEALPSLLDERGLAAGAFGLRGIPVTAVVRADGVVHAWQVGSRPDLAEWLAAEVEAALRALEAPREEPAR